MIDDLDGWQPVSEVKNDCAQCSLILVEHKFAACPYDRHEFPAAKNCPACLPEDCND